MGYSATTWADGVTVVDATRLNNIENGITTLCGTAILVESYPRVDPETTDSARIERAIAAATAGDVLIFTSGVTYDINTTITISKLLHIVGYGATLSCVTAGLTPMFTITSIDGITIKGLTFDQNDLGRTSVYMNTTDHFIIEDCIFTGYNPDTSHDANDSGIRAEACTDGMIAHNKWKQHGYAYDTTAATLSRCITLSGATWRVRIIGNEFFEVNQGIVSTGNDIMITGNLFHSVRDNPIYIVGDGVNTPDGVVITGNDFNNAYQASPVLSDECIVIRGRNITISGNTMKEYPTAFIAICEDVDNLTISGNTMENYSYMNLCQFIKWRDLTYKVTNAVITGNIFRQQSINSSTATAYFMYFGDFDNLLFANNLIDMPATETSQRLMTFAGATIMKGVIRENTFIALNAQVPAAEVTTTTMVPTLIFENNRFVLCRAVNTPGMYARHQGYGSNYISNAPTTRIIHASAAPATYQTFEKGDTVYNTAPAAAGYMGWVCTQAGSNGSLSGITGDINNGEDTLTLNSLTGIYAGQYITIAGVTGIKRIVSYVVATKVCTLDSVADATVATAAVARSAPVWKGFGVIEA